MVDDYRCDSWHYFPSSLGTDADREKRNAWCYMFTSFENIDTSGMLSINKLAGYCTYFRSNSCGNCDTKNWDSGLDSKYHFFRYELCAGRVAAKSVTCVNLFNDYYINRSILKCGNCNNHDTHRNSRYPTNGV